jgi:hypothetical protein
MAGRIVSRPRVASRPYIKTGVGRRLGLSTLTVGLCAGAALLARPALAAVLNANNQASFVEALNNAKNGDTINIAPDITITLSANPPAVSKSITINGNGSTISGTGLTIITATAAINNLNFVNTIAKGGDGGPGSGRGGVVGEGAGLGGGLLILGGANVTATNVTFQNDRGPRW